MGSALYSVTLRKGVICENHTVEVSQSGQLSTEIFLFLNKEPCQRRQGLSRGQVGMLEDQAMRTVVIYGSISYRPRLQFKSNLFCVKNNKSKVYKVYLCICLSVQSSSGEAEECLGQKFGCRVAHITHPLFITRCEVLDPDSGSGGT